MKTLLTFFFSFYFLPAFANMASPIRPGSLFSNPFTSLEVDILHEKLLIIPDSNFSTAEFFVEYHIEAKQAATQLPLLFLAADYEGDFQVWLDDTLVQLLPLPEEYFQEGGQSLSHFDPFLGEKYGDGVQTTDITDPSLADFYVSTDHLKYFEVDLSAGNHVIKVQYIANRWEDRGGNMNRYDFRYILSPAKYWKSFGGLELIVDASACPLPLSSNVGEPTEGSLSSVARWTFDSLPQEALYLTFAPEMPARANSLQHISPIGLSVGLGIALLLFHLYAMAKFRSRFPNKRFSWVMLVGSLLVPALAFGVYVGYLLLFDHFLGEYGGMEGLAYLLIAALLLFPIVLVVYLLGMWLADYLLAKQFRSEVP